MIMYTVAKGTGAIAYNIANDVDANIITSKENVFTDTINDPIAYHNGRRHRDGSRTYSDIFDPDYYAEHGYYVFHRDGWMLAVKGPYVKSD
jgi:hypothetical protein